MKKNNIKRFRELAESTPSHSYLEKLNQRTQDDEWLEESFKVALIVLRVLRAKNWTQKLLADKMGVSAQQVNKIVKGQENLSIQTIKKLERALGVSIMKIGQPDGAYLVNISAGRTETPIKVGSIETTYMHELAIGRKILLGGGSHGSSIKAEDLCVSGN